MERSSADNSPSQLAIRLQNRANCSSPSPPGKQTRPQESRSRVKTAESRYAAVLHEVLSSQLRLQTCRTSPRRDLRPLELVLCRLRLPHRRGVRGTSDRFGGHRGERRGAGGNRLRGKQRGGDWRGSPRRGSERRAWSVEQRRGTRRGQGNRRRRGRHFYCLFDLLTYLWG